MIRSQGPRLYLRLALLLLKVYMSGLPGLSDVPYLQKQITLPSTYQVERFNSCLAKNLNQNI